MSSPVKTDDNVPTPQANADHLYDNLNSPTYEMASEAQDSSPMIDDPEAKERQMREWRAELEKVEQEITTLRQVLGSKVRYASELKRKLGISPLQEMKQDFSEGLKFIKESDTYQKTSAAAKSAVEKTSNVASSIGASVSRKLGDIRNSDTFKSLEVKVESTYASVKAKVTGSKSETSFEEALQSETNRMNAGNEDASKEKEMTGKLPEEKVPL
ncbi:hypothetical protein ACJMK2_002294 [Sinanodonta woodiana]|uniref:Tumor protein D52 n=1 Tax=Sinanodonta woodiana TaxID=1069815 RepID=A0ABD3XUX7_SINWO